MNINILIPIKVKQVPIKKSRTGDRRMFMSKDCTWVSSLNMKLPIMPRITRGVIAPAAKTRAWNIGCLERSTIASSDTSNKGLKAIKRPKNVSSKKVMIIVKRFI